MDNLQTTNENDLLKVLGRLIKIANQKEISSQDQKKLETLLVEIQGLQEVPPGLPEVLEDLAIETTSWNMQTTEPKE